MEWSAQRIEGGISKDKRKIHEIHLFECHGNSSWTSNFRRRTGCGLK
jgi:hypothetical protein